MPNSPPPADWPRLSSSIAYQDAAAAIDWLCRAFGFEVRLKVEGDDGKIVHSELEYGEGLIMVGQEGTPADERIWKQSIKSPKSLGGACSQSIMMFVDDADAHCAHARSCGAVIVDEPSLHDYGADYWADRSYGALDLEGHIWWITQRISTGGK